jgi:hypothetical protein
MQAGAVGAAGAGEAAVDVDALGRAAKPSGGAPRIWSCLLVVTVTGLSACAGTATNSVGLPTLPQFSFLVIFVLLTTLLARQAQPLTKEHLGSQTSGD